MRDVQGRMGRLRAIVAFAILLAAPISAHADALDDAARARAAFAAAKTPRDREDAQYEQAIALYHARLYAVAYALFSEIASHPTHAHFDGALPWLARLAVDLPEPADVAERVGKYDEAAIGAVDPSLRTRLFYLLGRYRDRNHQYEDARRAYARVEAASPWYPKARFLMGVVAVKLRRPAEAIAAFQDVVDATQDDEDYDRIKNLALLSIARTYYSTAVRIDAHGAAVTDRALLAKALAFWNAVDVGDQSWQDVLVESSWALFLTGDHTRALGNLHMLAMMSPRWESPEADELRATIHLASCRYDDVATLAARSLARRRPVATELRDLVAKTSRED
ncbi:MAG TPA: tetratricopeptide repeat protein, partial [Labilithrix sp.]